MSRKKVQEQQRRVAHLVKEQNTLRKSMQASDTNTSEKSSHCEQALLFTSHVDLFVEEKKEHFSFLK
jgi:hypothetical protein